MPYFRDRAIAQGYLHIHGLYDPGYVRWLESLLSSEPERAVQNIMENWTTLLVARDIIGCDLHTTGENNYNYKPTKIYLSWHQDFPIKIPYNAWRFALYFRDYKGTKEGSIVFKGFDEYGAYNDGDIYIAPSPGDLVIWNLRTWHSARVSGKLPRNALFFDYGSKEDVSRYVNWRAEVRKNKEGK